MLTCVGASVGVAVGGDVTMGGAGSLESHAAESDEIRRLERGVLTENLERERGAAESKLLQVRLDPFTQAVAGSAPPGSGQ